MCVKMIIKLSVKNLFQDYDYVALVFSVSFTYFYDPERGEMTEMTSIKCLECLPRSWEARDESSGSSARLLI